MLFMLFVDIVVIITSSLDFPFLALLHTIDLSVEIVRYRSQYYHQSAETLTETESATCTNKCEIALFDIILKVL